MDAVPKSTFREATYFTFTEASCRQGRVERVRSCQRVPASTTMQARAWAV
jgi:hypothetical protein